jgi:cytidine deaminase
MSPSRIDWPALKEAAFKVRKNAHAPYSKFKVGAAVLSDDGRVFVGANVENASYGLTICAERSAVTAAVAAGAKHLIAVAIATAGPRPTAPCGACRQVLHELGSGMHVRAYNLKHEELRTTLNKLLPNAFDVGDL